MDFRLRLALRLEQLRRRNLKTLHPLQQLFCADATAQAEVPDTEITPHVDPHKVLIIISGGEPLMRKDLELVGRALYDRGYPWGMVTNGLALTPERFRALRQAGLRSMAISLDGLKDDHVWLRQHPIDAIDSPAAHWYKWSRTLPS